MYSQVLVASSGSSFAGWSVVAQTICWPLPTTKGKDTAKDKGMPRLGDASKKLKVLQRQVLLLRDCALLVTMMADAVRFSMVRLTELKTLLLRAWRRARTIDI